MKVRELVAKLLLVDQDLEVWMQDAGDANYGSDLTGYMGSDCAEAEDVRKIAEGLMITKYQEN